MFFTMESNGNATNGKATRPDVVIYCWDTLSKMFAALVATLERNGYTEVTIVRLTPNSAQLIESSKHILKLEDHFFPFVSVSGEFVKDLDEFESVIQFQPSEVCLKSECECKLSFKPMSNLSPLEWSPPLVTFLDKGWKWSNLVLKLVETFGTSLEKSLDDPVMPEQFLIDCMRRNLGIESVIDCRVLLYDLINNGMLEEIGADEYRFTYNLNYYGMNLNKRVDGDSTPVNDIPVVNLISTCIDLFSQVTTLHSIVYLDFLDHIELLRNISWEEFTHKKTYRKLLVDLYSVMSRHIDIHGAILLEERGMFYYQFKDRKIHLQDIRRLIMTLTCKSEIESINSLLLLKWTLCGNPDIDSQILSTARDVVMAGTVRAHNEQTYIPRFFSGMKGKRYSFFMSPFN